MKKTITFKLRMSEMDYKIISKKAELLDVSIAEYMRQTATNKQVKGFKLADLNLPETQCKGQMSIADMI